MQMKCYDSCDKQILLNKELARMTLDALRCFCALVETGSFRAAAEQVHRSQPAISQQMKSLERELGHALFDRRTAQPTPLGEMAYGRAREILLAVETLAREAGDFDESVGHELRVGTSDTTAMYVLPPCVRQFAEAMPHTRLVLVNRSSEAIAEQVLRGDLDLGIVTLPCRKTELEEQELFRQRLVLVTPQNHPLAQSRRAPLTALVHEPLLLIDAQTRTGALLRDYFRQEGFIAQVVLDSGSFEVIKRYVAEGVGLSFLPEAVIAQEDSGLTAVEIPGLPMVPIGVIRRRGAYRSKAERAFLEVLRAHR